VRVLAAGQPRQVPGSAGRLNRWLRVAAAAAGALGVLIGFGGASALATGPANTSASAPATVAGSTSGSSAGGAAELGSPSPQAAEVQDCDSLTSCYTAHQLQVAYGVRALLGQGINGSGQTVVLPELAQTALSPPAVSDIRQDLAQFDRLSGLPAARLQVVTRLAGPVSPFLANGEEVQDAEIIHALAPDAAIRVILLSPTALATTASAAAGLTAALRMAPREGGIMSVSAGWGEHCLTRPEVARMHAALRADADQHVTVVASSGDNGVITRPCPGSPATAPWEPVRETNMPAEDPLVLSAGGTTLTASHTTGRYLGETAWSSPAATQGSGGGFSRLFARPAYQDGAPGTHGRRGVPDVAADADGRSGLAVIVSDTGQAYTVFGAKGTSASAPAWSAVIALADQYAHRRLGFIDPAVYRIGRSARYHHAFHDITQGTNTVQLSGETITGYAATPGWDPVTGWGSPDARVLVPLLARYARACVIRSARSGPGTARTADGRSRSASGCPASGSCRPHWSRWRRHRSPWRRR
jgi:subtilase family serine protease